MGVCCIPCNALYVIASVAWQSPGRATASKAQCATHSRRFMGVGILITAEKTTRGPHKILVLVGLNY